MATAARARFAADPPAAASVARLVESSPLTTELSMGGVGGIGVGVVTLALAARAAAAAAAASAFAAARSARRRALSEMGCVGEGGRSV